MTLMKSLLLGSAAGIVAVASAQAADLPTKKGAPAAEYVKICSIDGKAGFVIPGSDTCLKISGYITGSDRRRQSDELAQIRRVHHDAAESAGRTATYRRRRRPSARLRLHHPR